MSVEAFKAEIEKEGYKGLFSSLPPNHSNPAHTHDFDARVMVLGGEITITRDGVPTTFRAGDSCAVPMGTLHAEQVGPDGVAYLAGRRYKA